MTDTSTQDGSDYPPGYFTDAPVYPFGDDPQAPKPEHPIEEVPPPLPDYAGDAESQAMTDHQSTCGCILPANRPVPPHPEQYALGGIWGIPITVPSSMQNRTTQPIGRHKRHPTNAIKPMSVITYYEQNPPAPSP